MTRVLYALVAAAVTTGAAGGLSAGVLALPKGPVRDAADRFVAAPGRAVMERVETKEVKKLRKRAAKRIKKATKRIEEGAERLEDAADRLRGTDAGERAEDALGDLADDAVETLGDQDFVEGAGDAKDRLEELSHYYNVGVWSLAGFAFCFLGTLLMGVSSVKAALSLGVKVTVFMIFLQGAFVMGGVLVWQNLHG